eukprot:jgi/Mesvir1/8881/Mv02769-RA.2
MKFARPSIPGGQHVLVSQLSGERVDDAESDGYETPASQTDDEIVPDSEEEEGENDPARHPLRCLTQRKCTANHRTESPRSDTVVLGGASPHKASGTAACARLRSTPNVPLASQALIKISLRALRKAASVLATDQFRPNGEGENRRLSSPPALPPLRPRKKRCRCGAPKLVNHAATQPPCPDAHPESILGPTNRSKRVALGPEDCHPEQESSRNPNPATCNQSPQQRPLPPRPQPPPSLSLSPTQQPLSLPSSLPSPPPWPPPSHPTELGPTGRLLEHTVSESDVPGGSSGQPLAERPVNIGRVSLAQGSMGKADAAAKHNPPGGKASSAGLLAGVAAALRVCGRCAECGGKVRHGQPTGGKKRDRDSNQARDEGEKGGRKGGGKEKRSRAKKRQSNDGGGAASAAGAAGAAGAGAGIAGVHEGAAGKHGVTARRQMPAVNKGHVVHRHRHGVGAGSQSKGQGKSAGTGGGVGGHGGAARGGDAAGKRAHATMPAAGGVAASRHGDAAGASLLDVEPERLSHGGGDDGNDVVLLSDDGDLDGNPRQWRPWDGQPATSHQHGTWDERRSDAADQGGEGPRRGGRARSPSRRILDRVLRSGQNVAKLQQRRAGGVKSQPAHTSGVKSQPAGTKGHGLSDDDDGWALGCSSPSGSISTGLPGRREGLGGRDGSGESDGDSDGDGGGHVSRHRAASDADLNADDYDEHETCRLQGAHYGSPSDRSLRDAGEDGMMEDIDEDPAAGYMDANDHLGHRQHARPPDAATAVFRRRTQDTNRLVGAGPSKQRHGQHNHDPHQRPSSLSGRHHGHLHDPNHGRGHSQHGRNQGQGQGQGQGQQRPVSHRKAPQGPRVNRKRSRSPPWLMSSPVHAGTRPSAAHAHPRGQPHPHRHPPPQIAPARGRATHGVGDAPRPWHTTSGGAAGIRRPRRAPGQPGRRAGRSNGRDDWGDLQGRDDVFASEEEDINDDHYGTDGYDDHDGGYRYDDDDGYEGREEMDEDGRRSTSPSRLANETDHHRGDVPYPPRAGQAAAGARTEGLRDGRWPAGHAGTPGRPGGRQARAMGPRVQLPLEACRQLSMLYVDLCNRGGSRQRHVAIVGVPSGRAVGGMGGPYEGHRMDWGHSVNVDVDTSGHSAAPGGALPGQVHGMGGGGEPAGAHATPTHSGGVLASGRAMDAGTPNGPQTTWAGPRGLRVMNVLVMPGDSVLSVASQLQRALIRRLRMLRVLAAAPGAVSQGGFMEGHGDGARQGHVPRGVLGGVGGEDEDEGNTAEHLRSTTTDQAIMEEVRVFLRLMTDQCWQTLPANGPPPAAAHPSPSAPTTTLVPPQPGRHWLPPPQALCHSLAQGTRGSATVCTPATPGSARFFRAPVSVREHPPPGLPRRSSSSASFLSPLPSSSPPLPSFSPPLSQPSPSHLSEAGELLVFVTRLVDAVDTALGPWSPSSLPGLSAYGGGHAGGADSAHGGENGARSGVDASSQGGTGMGGRAMAASVGQHRGGSAHNGDVAAVARLAWEGGALGWLWATSLAKGACAVQSPGCQNEPGNSRKSVNECQLAPGHKAHGKVCRQAQNGTFCDREPAPKSGPPASGITGDMPAGASAAGASVAGGHLAPCTFTGKGTATLWDVISQGPGRSRQLYNHCRRLLLRLSGLLAAAPGAHAQLLVDRWRAAEEEKRGTGPGAGLGGQGAGQGAAPTGPAAGVRPGGWPGVGFGPSPGFRGDGNLAGDSADPDAPTVDAGRLPRGGASADPLVSLWVQLLAVMALCVRDWQEQGLGNADEQGEPPQGEQGLGWSPVCRDASVQASALAAAAAGADGASCAEPSDGRQQPDRGERPAELVAGMIWSFVCARAGVAWENGAGAFLSNDRINHGDRASHGEAGAHHAGPGNANGLCGLADHPAALGSGDDGMHEGCPHALELRWLALLFASALFKREDDGWVDSLLAWRRVSGVERGPGEVRSRGLELSSAAATAATAATAAAASTAAGASFHSSMPGLLPPQTATLASSVTAWSATPLGGQGVPETLAPLFGPLLRWLAAAGGGALSNPGPGMPDLQCTASSASSVSAVTAIGGIRAEGGVARAPESLGLGIGASDHPANHRVQPSVVPPPTPMGAGSVALAVREEGCWTYVRLLLEGSDASCRVFEDAKAGGASFREDPVNYRPVYGDEEGRPRGGLHPVGSGGSSHRGTGVQTFLPTFFARLPAAHGGQRHRYGHGRGGAPPSSAQHGAYREGAEERASFMGWDGGVMGADARRMCDALTKAAVRRCMALSLCWQPCMEIPMLLWTRLQQRVTSDGNLPENGQRLACCKGLSRSLLLTDAQGVQSRVVQGLQQLGPEDEPVCHTVLRIVCCHMHRLKASAGKAQILRAGSKLLDLVPSNLKALPSGPAPPSLAPGIAQTHPAWASLYAQGGTTAITVDISRRAASEHGGGPVGADPSQGPASTRQHNATVLTQLRHNADLLLLQACLMPPTQHRGILSRMRAMVDPRHCSEQMAQLLTRALLAFAVVAGEGAAASSEAEARVELVATEVDALLWSLLDPARDAAEGGGAAPPPASASLPRPPGLVVLEEISHACARGDPLTNPLALHAHHFLGSFALAMLSPSSTTSPTITPSIPTTAAAPLTATTAPPAAKPRTASPSVPGSAALAASAAAPTVAASATKPTHPAGFATLDSSCYHMVSGQGGSVTGMLTPAHLKLFRSALLALVTQACALMLPCAPARSAVSSVDLPTGLYGGPTGFSSASRAEGREGDAGAAEAGSVGDIPAGGVPEGNVPNADAGPGGVPATAMAVDWDDDGDELEAMVEEAQLKGPRTKLAGRVASSFLHPLCCLLSQLQGGPDGSSSMNNLAPGGRAPPAGFLSLARQPGSVTAAGSGGGEGEGRVGFGWEVEAVAAAWTLLLCCEGLKPTVSVAASAPPSSLFVDLFMGGGRAGVWCRSEHWLLRQSPPRLLYLLLLAADEASPALRSAVLRAMDDRGSPSAAAAILATWLQCMADPCTTLQLSLTRMLAHATGLTAVQGHLEGLAAWSEGTPLRRGWASRQAPSKAPTAQGTGRMPAARHGQQGQGQPSMPDDPGHLSGHRCICPGGDKRADSCAATEAEGRNPRVQRPEWGDAPGRCFECLGRNGVSCAAHSCGCSNDGAFFGSPSCGAVCQALLPSACGTCGGTQLPCMPAFASDELRWRMWALEVVVARLTKAKEEALRKDACQGRADGSHAAVRATVALLSPMLASVTTVMSAQACEVKRRIWSQESNHRGSSQPGADAASKAALARYDASTALNCAVAGVLLRHVTPLVILLRSNVPAAPAGVPHGRAPAGVQARGGGAAAHLQSAFLALEDSLRALLPFVSSGCASLISRCAAPSGKAVHYRASDDDHDDHDGDGDGGGDGDGSGDGDGGGNNADGAQENSLVRRALQHCLPGIMAGLAMMDAKARKEVMATVVDVVYG